MADFAAGSPDLTHPPPLPGLGTGYVETTQESLPVNLVLQYGTLVIFNLPVVTPQSQMTNDNEYIFLC